MSFIETINSLANEIQKIKSRTTDFVNLSSQFLKNQILKQNIIVAQSVDDNSHALHHKNKPESSKVM